MISFIFTDYYYYYWNYLQRLHCDCLVVRLNPNTLGEKPKVYGRTNLGGIHGKTRLSCINFLKQQANEFELTCPSRIYHHRAMVGYPWICFLQVIKIWAIPYHSIPWLQHNFFFFFDKDFSIILSLLIKFSIIFCSSKTRAMTL